MREEEGEQERRMGEREGGGKGREGRELGKKMGEMKMKTKREKKLHREKIGSRGTRNERKRE